jgi:imidazolonepropionase-like amidohydrolase
MAPRQAVLVNAHVVDAASPEPRADQGVWVRDGRIAAVGPVDDVLAEAGPGNGDTATIDLGGAHLLPGLVNMHVHLGLKLPGGQTEQLANETDAALALRMADNARKALHAGVTTVRLVAEKNHVDFALRAAIERGETAGPRIYTAGMAICCTGGHGRGSGAVEADGPAEVRKATRDQIKQGADLVKVMASGGISGEFEGASGLQLGEDELEAAIGVAHAWGRKVTAHAGPAEVVRAGVEAGLDCVEHGYGLTAEVAELMAARGVWYVPTLTVTRCKDFFERIEAPAWMMERALSQGERHLESYRAALEEGVEIALGTDMLPAEPYDGTSATVRELEHMVEGGMTSYDALVAATAKPAQWLGLAGELGTVEPGKHADLVAAPANPAEDITALRELFFVMRAGIVHRHDRDDR